MRVGFKPSTDDVREAFSFVISHTLLAAGVRECTHDLEAVARRVLGADSETWSSARVHAIHLKARMPWQL